MKTDNVSCQNSDCLSILQSQADRESFCQYLAAHLDEIIHAIQSPLMDKYPKEVLKKIMGVGGDIARSQPNLWKPMWLIALVAGKLGEINLVDKACKIVLSLNKEFWFARELPKHVRGYYSQLGQDEFIERYFSERKPKSKTFVEVGAFDGIHYSNVRRLVEKQGWHGVSIEPVGKNYAKLCQSYLGYDVKCIRAAVSNHTGTEEMNVSTYPHLPEWGSDVASLSAEDNVRWTKTYGAKWEKESVAVKTLTDIFSENGLKDVDLLSIDAEGHDMEVLGGLDFSKYKPQLIVVEYGDKRNDFVKLLSAKGYSLVYDNRQDLFFADIQPVLTGCTTRNYAAAGAQEPYAAIQDDVEQNICSYLGKNAESGLRIVIVGAYYGDEIGRFLKRYAQAEIIAFEANPHTFQKLREKYKKHPNVHCYPYAVSDRNGTLEFYENTISGTGSILPIESANPGRNNSVINVAEQYNIGQKEKFAVESIRLDEFEPLKNKPIDLLWCDVQGAELHVLKGAQKTLRNCNSLFLEVWFYATLYKEQARLTDLEQFLAGQGFHLAGIGLDHKIGNGSGNSFWLNQRVESRTVCEEQMVLCELKKNCFVGKNIDNVKMMSPYLKTSAATAMVGAPVKKQKIVGFVAARNEEHIIGQCLWLLSQFTDAIVYLDDCSTDDSVKIVQGLTGQCNVERIITKEQWLRDEPGDRNKMLQAGREIGGTHFIVLDADEAFTSNFFNDNALRKKISSLGPGDRLLLNWICLWRSVGQYRHDKSVWTNNYKPFVFCDDGRCSYSSEFIHTPRVPQNLTGRTIKVEGYEYGVLHFQFVNWYNLLLKQAWYRCLERIREPQKSIVEINKRYAPSKDETNIHLEPSNPEWFQHYPDFDCSVFEKPDNWRTDQIRGWFREYGADFFKELDIWDIITPQDDIHCMDSKTPFRGTVDGPVSDGSYLVSAIVSTYNSEAFIRGCLQDLVEQTLYRKGLLEIVVVNSGSQQNEEAIVKEYQSGYPHIQYIKTSQRETIYAAWNRGIRAARGKYITNANTDDRHSPEMLEKMAATLEVHPDVAYVYSLFYRTLVCNQTWQTKTPSCVSSWVQEYSRETLLGNYYCGPQPMWRRSLHEEYGYFDQRFRVCGDYEFVLRISQTHKLMRIPEVLGLYYRGPNNLERSAGTHDQEKEFIVRLYNQFRHSVIRRPLAYPLPQFSVVCHNYNKEKYIGDAIQSVLNQTFQDWEMVIVDDASTDNSVEVIKHFLHDPRIRLIRREKNGGIARAVMTGIANIRAEVYGELDSDDALTPNAVEVIVKAHQEHPECGFIYSQFMICDAKLKPLEAGYCEKMPEGQTTLEADVASHFRTYKLKDYLKTPGHDPQLDCAVDKDMIHKIEEVTHVHFVPQPLYLLRQLPQSASHGSEQPLKAWLSWARSKINAYRRRSCKAAIEQKRDPAAAFGQSLAGAVKHDLHIHLLVSMICKYEDILSRELSIPSELAGASRDRLIFWIAAESDIKELLNVFSKHHILKDSSWIVFFNQYKNEIWRLRKSEIIPFSPAGEVSKTVSSHKDNNGSENDPAIKIFLEAQKTFALGNMVSARRLMAQYQARMDYSKLQRIDRRTGQTSPLISVIIVACQRAEDLIILLDCLPGQTFHDFETIVVDNGGSDIQRIIDKADCIIPCPINFKPSEGRNIGVYFARGKITVFLDDDALVKSDYLASVLKAFETCDILGLRGKVLPKTAKDNHLPSIYDRGDKPFPTDCNLEGNAAFLTEAWRAVGGQDPLLFGGEGSDFSWRLIAASGRKNAVIYWPQTVLYHDYGDSEKTRKKELRYQFVRSYLLYKHNCDITQLRKSLEVLTVTAGNSLNHGQTHGWADNHCRNSLGYTADSSRAAAVPGPKVSVVMSCFNAANYLAECLDSIRAQTLTDWEAVIVDDGSTDDTHRILKDYAARDTRFRIYLNSDNRGPYVRRNFAIQQTRASFIAIHDADDIMSPYKLEILLNEILRDERLNVVGSFFGWFMGDFKGQEYCDVAPLSITHREILTTFFTQYICCHASAIIRKTFFDRIGLYDEQPWSSDSFWMGKAGFYGLLTDSVQFRNVPECLTFIRKHDDSQTGRINPRDPRGRRRYFGRYYTDKLQQIAEKKKRIPNLNIEQELQQCTCRDFIPRFGHLFEQWESATVSPEMIENVLNEAVEEISNRMYVKATIALDTLHKMLPGIEKTFRGLSLLRGLCCFAWGDRDGAGQFLQQEYRDHQTPQAGHFMELYLAKPCSLNGRERREIVDAFVFAYPEKGNSAVEVLYDNRGSAVPAVSVLMDCRHGRIDLDAVISEWAAQTDGDFELLLLTAGNKKEDFAALNSLPVPTVVVNGDDVLDITVRTKAVSLSRGQILVFASGHLTMPQDGVRTIRHIFKTSSFSAVRGRIRTDFPYREPGWDLGDNPAFCAVEDGTLSAFRRDVFDKVHKISQGVWSSEFLSHCWLISRESDSIFGPVCYVPQFQATLRKEHDFRTDWPLRRLSQRQVYWKLSMPHSYLTFLAEKQQVVQRLCRANSAPVGQPQPAPQKAPLVSVYMVAYNAQRFIRPAIDSVLTQTFRDFELLVVDDGSTDRTISIVQSCQDPRIRVIRREHKNFAAGMNAAIQQARGQFVIGVDSDDIIEPDYLERLVCFAQAHPHHDYYYPAALKLIDEQKRYAQDRWEYKNFEDNRILPAFLFIHGFSPIPNSGSLKRKALFEKTGLYRELDTVEDFDFLSRNALHIRFKRAEGAAGYRYRIHADSNSNRMVQRNRITAEAIAAMTKLYAPQILCPSLQSVSGMEKEAKYRRFIQNVFRNLAECHAGRGGEAFERYAAAWRNLSEISDLKTENLFGSNATFAFK